MVEGLGKDLRTYFGVRGKQMNIAEGICAHKNIRTEADICYLEDIGEWAADIKIKCIDCGEPFHFKGLPMGCSLITPCVSVDATELRIPIMPGILMPHMRKDGECI